MFDFATCCNFLTDSCKENCLIFSIDVALKNFSISSQTTKRNVRIDFSTPAVFEKTLPRFIKQLVAGGPPKVIFKSEKQISRATKNLKLEYFLRGVIKALCTETQKLSYIEYPPKQKKIAAAKVGWQYEKIRSAKKFKALAAGNTFFAAAAVDWTCAHLDIKLGKFYIFETVWKQKKFDDFVDNLLILLP